MAVRLQARATTDTAGRPMAASAAVLRLVTTVSHPEESIDVRVAVETIIRGVVRVSASPSLVISLMSKVVRNRIAPVLVQVIVKDGVPLPQDDSGLTESRGKEGMQHRDNQKH